MKDYIIGSLAGIRAGFFCNPFGFVKRGQQFQDELKKLKAHNNLAQKVLNESSKSVVSGRMFHWQQYFGNSGLYKNIPTIGWMPYRRYNEHYSIPPYFYGIATALQSQLQVEKSVLHRIININNWRKLRTFYNTAILPTFWGSFICDAVNGYPLRLTQTQSRLQQSVDKYADIYRHYSKGLWGYLSNIIRTQGFTSFWGGYNMIVPRSGIGPSSQLASSSSSKDMILQYEVFQKSASLTSGVSSLLSGIAAVGAMGPVDCVTKRLLFSQGYEGCPFTNHMRKLSLHGINWTNASSLVKPGFAKSFYWNICGIAKRLLWNTKRA